MPIPLDHGRPERPPAGAPPRPAPAGRPALPRMPLAAGRARRPLRALSLGTLLRSLPLAARTRAAAVTPGSARLRPGHCHGGPDRYRSAPDPSLSGLLRAVLRAARRPPRALPLAAWYLGAVFAAWLAGCAPSAHATAGAGDPLAALAAPDSSRTFDLAFWVQEQATRSLLWRQAFAFCRLHPALPNCRTVRMASWWGSPPASPAPPATSAPPSPAAAVTGPAGTATPPPASAGAGPGGAGPGGAGPGGAASARPPLVSAAVRPARAAAPSTTPGATAYAPAHPSRLEPGAGTAPAAAPPPTRSPEGRHS
jgi:hypothetical protein